MFNLSLLANKNLEMVISPPDALDRHQERFDVRLLGAAAEGVGRQRRQTTQSPRSRRQRGQS